MSRFLSASFFAIAILATSLQPAAAQPVIPDDFSGIDNSLLHGTVTPPGAEISEKFKELEAYDELVYGYPALTEAEITTIYFKDGAFAPVANPSRTYFPRSDVKIVRDAEWGVPHIYGLTDAAAAFGAGYAAVEDRLPIIQALNALGRSEAFELAADSPSWFADAEVARLQGYTEAEFQAMIDRMPVVFGQDGQDIADLLDELSNGMNAALLGIQTGLLPLPDGLTLADVLAIGPFQPTDIVAIVSIVRSLFGAGGGSELSNASRMLSLVNEYGEQDGLRIYEDFRNRFHDDGIVHTTDSFPYGQVPQTIDPNSSPYPTPYSGGDPGLQVTFEELLGLFFSGGMAQAQTQTADLAEQSRIKWENLVVEFPSGARIDLSRPGQLSNYVVIDGTISSTGHPILLGGPQAGYFDPQILVENELHGDRIHARGAGFPGMGFVVIGRNPDAAWTPTAGGSDMVDIYIEELCDPEGGAPAENEIHYLFDGNCVPMDRRVHRLAPSPNPELLPDIIVERTIHGVVQARGLIGSTPVAVSRKRSTYLKELDAAVAILRLNRNEVPDGATFVRDFTESMNLSTNWAYANANEIAYVHGGLYPVRPPNTHPDLPLWGTGGYEWQTDPGLANVARAKHAATDVTDDVYLSDLAPAGVLSLHPHELTPERHYTISWNNRPAPDWSASDAQWGYSSVYRADLLEDLVLHEIEAGQPITPVRLVQIMEHAGLSDLRGTHVLPEALEIIQQADNIGDREAQMIETLEAWAENWTDFANAEGPLRRDGDRDGNYDEAEAIGIMDAWWDPMIHAMYDPALGGRAVDTVSRQGFHNAPGLMGSAFQGGFYGQVRTDLAMVLGNPLNSPTSQIYCGTTPDGVGVDGALKDCANALLASLESIDPSPTSALAERILFLPTAALTMHWVNRPTTQGLAMFGPSAQALPEPGRALLLGAGLIFLALLAALRSRRARAVATGAALVVALAVLPRAANALSFQFLGEFDVGAFGPDKGSAGTGTPRGLALGAGGILYVSDALDDQVFETSGGSLVGAIPTDPLCDVTADPCVSSGTNFARVVFDAAYDPGSDQIWLVDKNGNGDNLTRLFQLDSDGLFLNSYEVTSSVVQPRGMELDPRNGELLVTRFSSGGPDSIVRFDITGAPSAVGAWFLPVAINSEGLAHYAGDLFLLADTANDKLYEYLLPVGGSPVLLGESEFVGIDPSTIGAKNSIEYDPVNDRLYVLDDTFDRVLIFSTVPEPGSLALLGSGLLAVALGRRRRS